MQLQSNYSSCLAMFRSDGQCNRDYTPAPQSRSKNDNLSPPPQARLLSLVSNHILSDVFDHLKYGPLKAHETIKQLV